MPATIFCLPIDAAGQALLAPAMESLPEGVERLRPQDLHLTLAVFDEPRLLTEDELAALQAIGAAVAAETQPIVLAPVALTQFDAPEGEELAAVVLLIDPAPLTALHDRLVSGAGTAGIAFRGFPDFLPHVTLGYAPPATVEAVAVGGPAVDVTQLALWAGPGRVTWDLIGQPARRAAIIEGLRMPASTAVERKALPHQVKAIEGRTVTGVFSVFGNRDSYDDIIEPGAFLATIAQRGAQVLHLWQHCMEEPPIAKVESLREITRKELPPQIQARFPEATGGVEVARTYLDTPRANEVFTNLLAGVPLQMSFAFEPVRFSITEDDAAEWGYTRRIQEVRLYETSDVNWGANEATVASKRAWLPDGAAERHELRSLLTALEAWRAEAKAGKRHSTADMATLNSIHRCAVDLGCDECMGIVTPEDPDIAEDDEKAARRLLVRADALAGALVSLVEATPDLVQRDALAHLVERLARRAAITIDPTPDPAAEAATVYALQQRARAAKAALALRTHAR